MAFFDNINPIPVFKPRTYYALGELIQTKDGDILQVATTKYNYCTKCFFHKFCSEDSEDDPPTCSSCMRKDCIEVYFKKL